jgi:hypothetical protein
VNSIIPAVSGLGLAFATGAESPQTQDRALITAAKSQLLTK